MKYTDESLNKWEAREIRVVLATTSTFRDGGATLWFDGIERRTGYVVGNNNDPFERLYHTRDLYCDALRVTLINGFVRHDSGDSEYDGIGTWVDGDGWVYFDNVKHIPKLEDALELARKNGELAIYDIANAYEIDL